MDAYVRKNESNATTLVTVAKADHDHTQIIIIIFIDHCNPTIMRFGNDRCPIQEHQRAFSVGCSILRQGCWPIQRAGPLEVFVYERILKRGKNKFLYE